MTPADVTVRPVSRGDVAEVVRLHAAAFDGFYLTALGPRFLRQYYREVAEFPGGICVRAYEGARLVGFAAGFVGPEAFYSALRANRVRLGLAALPALVADPRRAVRFLRNYRRTSVAANAAAPLGATAELASLAVDPAWTGRRIGEQLVTAFVSEAGLRGARAVTLTTDADRNDRVNGFYQRLGFHLERRFEVQPGRYLNEYSLGVRRDLGNAF